MREPERDLGRLADIRNAANNLAEFTTRTGTWICFRPSGTSMGHGNPGCPESSEDACGGLTILHTGTSAQYGWSCRDCSGAIQKTTTDISLMPVVISLKRRGALRQAYHTASVVQEPPPAASEHV